MKEGKRDMEKIKQTAIEIINFNTKVRDVIVSIKEKQLDVYISKTTPITISNEFLNYLISAIEFLTSFIGYLTNPSEYTQIKKDDMIRHAGLANVTLPDFDFSNLVAALRAKMSEFDIDNIRNPLLPEFLQLLKINFTVYEMFYEKQGKYYASTMTTFLTQCRQHDVSHEENVLFFPCNDAQRQQRGKISFAIWCQKHKQQRGGTPILNSGEVGVPIYERDMDDGPCVWTFQTVNMYRYLLEDYILYDFYTLLAFHFQLCNEVYYPFAEQSDIVERIEMPSLSGYLKKGTTFHYLDEFVDYIINEYNDPDNDKDNRPLTGPESPSFETGITESKCVDMVLKDLGTSKLDNEKSITPTTSDQDDLAAGVIQSATIQEEFNKLMEKLKKEVEDADDDFSKYEAFIRKKPDPISYLIDLNEKADALPGSLYDLLTREINSSTPIFKGLSSRTDTAMTIKEDVSDTEEQSQIPPTQIVEPISPIATLDSDDITPFTPEQPIEKRAVVTVERKKEEGKKGGTRKKKYSRKNKRTRGNKKRGKKTRKHTRRAKNKKTQKH